MVGTWWESGRENKRGRVAEQGGRQRARQSEKWKWAHVHTIVRDTMILLATRNVAWTKSELDVGVFKATSTVDVPHG